MLSVRFRNILVRCHKDGFTLSGSGRDRAKKEGGGVVRSGRSGDQKVLFYVFGKFYRVCCGAFCLPHMAIVLWIIINVLLFNL